MRRSFLALVGLAVLAVMPAQASIVIHDGQPGIVAESDWQFLDNLGQVWRIEADGTLHRQPEWDVPFPIESIKFWSHHRLVTRNDEFFWLDDATGQWMSLGAWPGQTSVDSDASGLGPSLKTTPNPSPGSCRIQFTASASGPLSITIAGIGGRVVRRLLDGPHPPGEYSLVWDGRDDSGSEVPSGVYITKVETSAGVTTGKVVLAH